MKMIKQTLMTGAALCAFMSVAQAEDGGLKDWSISGYNTVRGDVYDIDGNTAASPYPNGGAHIYDEFSLNASRQYSPYERLNLNILGVVNGSDYRNIDDGLVPERMQLIYENGADGVPYRVHLGDYYAGLSYRTLQRSLKGASLELQPFSSRERKHSILFFGGTNQPTYRSFDVDDDFHTGISWLIEDRDWGRASFNAVHSYQDETTLTLAGANNSQMMYSAAVETPFELLSQNFIFEGELAFFSGDYGVTKDRDDVASFAQLSGRSQTQPLDYRLRYERYGTDYRPNGAIITPDRRSIEAHAGWRFDWGTYLRGRVQRFEDSFDSTNEQTTDLIGANLSGPMFNQWITGLTGNIDIYQQQIDNQINSIDRDTDTLNASFNMPLWSSYNGQVSVFVQDMDDLLATDADMYIKQVGLGIFAPIMVGSMSGTINPGIALRQIDNDTMADSNEVHPTINLTLSNASHRLNANYGFLSQNRIGGTGLDIGTQTAGAEYAYTMGNHELGINGSYFDRDVDTALDTDAWRAGVYWTVRFNKPAGESFGGGDTIQTAALGGGSVVAPQLKLAGLSLLEDLQPGGLLSRATALLNEQGISSPSDRSGVKVYEASLINEVIERQRVVLEHGGGKVKKAGLVIDVTDTGSPRSVVQLYERTKQILVKQYGSPDNIVETGEFTSDVMGDINAERVVRVVEWKTPNGVIRYGMPRRLDGLVRIELQHAKRFPSPRNTLWSMDLY